MPATEFNTIVEQQMIRLPLHIPDGVPIHVILSWEPMTVPIDNLKQLFASVTEGLTDDDLARPNDSGREVLEWDI